MTAKGFASLTFLGTGASHPTRDRWLPGILARIRDEFLLLDCGEGVQYRILDAGLKVNKLSTILISHLHGDHVYGLPGLLESLNSWGLSRQLLLVGPRQLAEILDAMKLRERLNYKIKFVEAQDGAQLRGQGYTLTIRKVEHGMEAYAYVIAEDSLPGEFDAVKAQLLGVPAGPLRTKLVQGEPIVLDNGRVVYPEEVVKPGKKGLKIAYSGDTAPCPSLIDAAKDADLLIHEATFSMKHSTEAFLSFHSTSADAARVAREAKVKMLILTHFSNRYRDSDLDTLLAEARKIFPRSYLAKDMMRIKLRRLNTEWLLAEFEQILVPKDRAEQ